MTPKERRMLVIVLLMVYNNLIKHAKSTTLLIRSRGDPAADCGRALSFSCIQIKGDRYGYWRDKKQSR